MQVLEEGLSPVVQHKRMNPPGRASGITRSSMLLFASFSGGLAAIMLAFVVLITGVGLYSLLIWPLTFWDLANLGLEKYANWTGTITASVFAGGAFAGYWVFSGEPYKRKPQIQQQRVLTRSSR
jgi:hypothetical protein